MKRTHALRKSLEMARPVMYQNMNTSCWHPYVKGYVRSVNGMYTHNRMENIWLDK